MTVESVKNIHVFKMVVFEELKKLREHDIRGVGCAGAHATRGSLAPRISCLLSFLHSAQGLTLLNLFLC